MSGKAGKGRQASLGGAARGEPQQGGQQKGSWGGGPHLAEISHGLEVAVLVINPAVGHHHLRADARCTTTQREKPRQREKGAPSQQATARELGEERGCQQQEEAEYVSGRKAARQGTGRGGTYPAAAPRSGPGNQWHQTQ
jgi:hypothetical protein